MHRYRWQYMVTELTPPGAAQSGPGDTVKPPEGFVPAVDLHGAWEPFQVTSKGVHWRRALKAQHTASFE